MLLKLDGQAPRALLVRADPVLSSPDRAVGYVVLFTDLSERKEAERARCAFQQGIAEGRSMVAANMETPAGGAARSLLATLLENAQLAALEIADGVDALGMARRLESVRASVQRAAAMLERIVLHAGRRD